jgi:hypothetical protein
VPEPSQLPAVCRHEHLRLLRRRLRNFDFHDGLSTVQL